MARWGDVKLRMQRLQSAGVAVFETHAHKTTAFHLADYVSGGDAVLLFTKDVDPAGKLPVLISLETLEALIAAATAAERDKATRQTARQNLLHRVDRMSGQCYLGTVTPSVSQITML